MAARMKTSRAALDRLLDGSNTSLTLTSLGKAARALVRKVKIELVVADEIADACVASIANVARTGHIGDGKIFVSNVERALRIRTGEKDADAL